MNYFLPLIFLPVVEPAMRLLGVQKQRIRIVKQKNTMFFVLASRFAQARDECSQATAKPTTPVVERASMAAKHRSACCFQHTAG